MTKQLFQIAVLCGSFAVAYPAVPAVPEEAEIYRSVRSGSIAALDELLKAGVAVNHQDQAGNSLLLRTVVYGKADAVKFLIQRGADVNLANKAGATPLMRAAGQPDVIQLLVANGADVRARSGLGNTPLHTTARSFGASKSIELLLKAGADVNATNVFGATPLMIAAASGDLDSVKLLVKNGADVNAHSRGGEPQVIWGGGRSPLMWAAFRGNREIAKYLLESGADINSPEGFGSALSQAAWNDHADMAEFLLKRGAEVDLKDQMSEFTPLHWAAGSDRSSAAAVEVLLKHGANPNAEGGAPVDAFMGIPQTPMLIAKKRNETPITRALQVAGARDTAPKQTRELPVREISSVNESLLRAALTDALPLLEETATFSKGAFVQHSSKQDCVSCHQQYMPLTSFGFAKGAGIRAKETAETAVLEMVRRDNTNLFEMTAQATFHPEPGHGYGYALLTAAAQNEPPSPELDAMIHHLLVIQDRDGRWHNNLPRPPLQTSDFAPTALAIRGFTTYGFPVHQEEIQRRIFRARKWLQAARPANTEERAYQLLGLAWAGQNQKSLTKFATALMKEQRSDGGWAQLPGLCSDAYATGLSLFALAQAKSAGSAEFQKGLAYLLRTQQKDGTWHVRARAYPFQPTMRSGYPYSRDSWISATGASWAVMAISSALQERPLQVSAR